MLKIGTINFILPLILSSVTMASVQASIFDDELDANESAEAIIHCATKAKKLFAKNGPGERLSVVKGEHTKVSDNVDVKKYTFHAISGGGFMPLTEGNTLYVTLTVTQPPEGLMDAPSTLDWQCKLVKSK